jgi:hypothetical protein
MIIGWASTDAPCHAGWALYSTHSCGVGSASSLVPKLRRLVSSGLVFLVMVAVGAARYWGWQPRYQSCSSAGCAPMRPHILAPACARAKRQLLCVWPLMPGASQVPETRRQCKDSRTSRDGFNFIENPFREVAITHLIWMHFEVHSTMWQC